MRTRSLRSNSGEGGLASGWQAGSDWQWPASRRNCPAPRSWLLRGKASVGCFYLNRRGRRRRSARPAPAIFGVRAGRPGRIGICLPAAGIVQHHGVVCLRKKVSLGVCIYIYRYMCIHIYIHMYICTSISPGDTYIYIYTDCAWGGELRSPHTQFPPAPTPSSAAIYFEIRMIVRCLVFCVFAPKALKYFLGCIDSDTHVYLCTDGGNIGIAFGSLACGAPDFRNVGRNRRSGFQGREIADEIVARRSSSSTLSTKSVFGGAAGFHILETVDEIEVRRSRGAP